MRKELFLPTIEGEVRILLLIAAFSGGQHSLEGRTKLAKLDFFLRYPHYLERVLAIRKSDLPLGSMAGLNVEEFERNNIENGMIRYRYGPWDPAYYAILGRLIGKGLIEVVSLPRGLGYKATLSGQQLSRQISQDEYWLPIYERAKLLHKYLDLSGNSLKKLIYEHFPEVTGASWGERL